MYSPLVCYMRDLGHHVVFVFFADSFGFEAPDLQLAAISLDFAWPRSPYSVYVVFCSTPVQIHQHNCYDHAKHGWTVNMRLKQKKQQLKTASMLFWGVFDYIVSDSLWLFWLVFHTFHVCHAKPLVSCFPCFLGSSFPMWGWLSCVLRLEWMLGFGCWAVKKKEQEEYFETPRN